MARAGAGYQRAVHDDEMGADADIVGSVRAGSANKSNVSNRNPKLAARVEHALLRAGETARRTARMYGTPLYVWENGQVVMGERGDIIRLM